MTEEAARLIIKKHKRNFFGDLVNRIGGASWKEKLYSLEKITSRLPKTATGSYQNITLLQGYINNDKINYIKHVIFNTTILCLLSSAN